MPGIKKRKEKQNYTEELERMKQEEVNRCKRECELCANRKSYNSNAPVVFALITLVAVMSGVILYTVYELVHVTRISDLAGIHITPVIRKAANSLANEGSGSEAIEKAPGYENWLIYKNDYFSVMYPPDWEVKVNGNVVFKKYNDPQLKRYDSLDMTMTFGQFDNPGNLPVKQILSDNHRTLGNNPTEETIGGERALHTGRIVQGSGLATDGIYWTMDKKIFYLETVYYDKKTDDLDNTDCQKVVDSLRIF